MRTKPVLGTVVRLRVAPVMRQALRSAAHRQGRTQSEILRELVARELMPNDPTTATTTTTEPAKSTPEATTAQ